jgi:hypothetical protein
MPVYGAAPRFKGLKAKPASEFFFHAAEQLNRRGNYIRTYAVSGYQGYGIIGHCFFLIALRRGFVKARLSPAGS